MPQLAVVKVLAISRPAESRMRTLTTASKTSAVPDTVTGLVTCWPMTGLCTVMAGR